MSELHVSVSIVLCSRNEQEVIEETITSVSSSIAAINIPYEIVVIDDSIDNTPAIVSALSIKHPLRLIHRPKQEQDGLGGAIIRGFYEAKESYVILMDADGQHPSEVLKRLIPLAQSGYDLVVPSRYIVGGSTGGLDGATRNIYSSVLRQLPRVLFFRRLWRFTDPLSGLFMVRRSCLDFTRMKPDSWKVSLEVLLFGHWASYCEIPYKFQERSAGKSKANFWVGIDYLRHLLKLTARYYLHRSL